MQAHTHTYALAPTKAAPPAHTQTPDPAAGLRAGAQAQPQIHPRPEPMCWLAGEASHSKEDGRTH